MYLVGNCFTRKNLWETLVDAMDASQIAIWNTTTEAVMNMVKSASDWLMFAIDAPSPRTVVFGVHIGGMLPDHRKCMGFWHSFL